jgi:hypothetical protein
VGNSIQHPLVEPVELSSGSARHGGLIVKLGDKVRLRLVDKSGQMTGEFSEDWRTVLTIDHVTGLVAVFWHMGCSARIDVVPSYRLELLEKPV